MKKRDVLQDDLQDALKQQGCALCRISYGAVARQLELVLYDQINEAEVRQQVRDGLGYCNRHAWQMREMRGSALGLTFLYRDALLQLEEQINAATKSKGRGRFDILRAQIARAISPRAECFACRQQREIEGRYLSSFLHLLADSLFVERFAASDGLCRVHLQRAVEGASNSAALETFLSAQHGIHRRVLAEMNEFIRKNDYRFAGEGFGREGDAWIRAMELLSSPPGAQTGI